MDCRLACYVFIYLWTINFIHARKYNIRKLCDVQDGSVRISLEQGSYVQLNMEVDLDGPGTNCEIVIQSTHKDDGLLIYFEHFDYVGSNFATVFRRKPCGASILRMMDGEIVYVSSCIGSGLADAPSMSTYSSLGAVRLQLLPANLTTLTSFRPTNRATVAENKTTSPITFSVIATASQKSIVSEECPSGCCREPYMFKCPLLNYCIDVKLTCNNVTNCGPRVAKTQDENGVLCDNIVKDQSSEDNDRDVNVDDPDSNNNNNNNNEVIRRVWSDGTDSDDTDTKYPEVPHAFYTRVELVCGIVSIALFCLAGIGVLVCKVRTNSPQTRSRGNSSRRDSNQSAVYVINDSSSSTASDEQNQYSMAIASFREMAQESPNALNDSTATDMTEASSSSGCSAGATTIITCKPKTFAIDCEYCRTYDNDSETSYNVYIMDMDGRLHYPHCPKSASPAPPPYDSLFPKNANSLQE